LNIVHGDCIGGRATIYAATIKPVGGIIQRGLGQYELKEQNKKEFKKRNLS
jgi:hypothetical protein